VELALVSVALFIPLVVISKYTEVEELVPMAVTLSSVIFADVTFIIDSCADIKTVDIKIAMIAHTAGI
jgi:hypothetical protein